MSEGTQKQEKFAGSLRERSESNICIIEKMVWQDEICRMIVDMVKETK